MLVLTLKKDEDIIIGDDIRVMVVDFRGDKVRLGVSAPPGVSIHRKEVYDAIHRDGLDPNDPASRVRGGAE